MVDEKLATLKQLNELGNSMLNREARLSTPLYNLQYDFEKFRKKMWAVTFIWVVITIAFIVSAHATIYFNPVPNTLVNGTTGLSAQVNQNYNSILSDGNIANTSMLAQIAALGPGGLPIGAVLAFNGSCPTGLVLADGSLGKPDVRGLFIRGLDNGAGRDLNRVLNSYQADQIQNHFHTAPSFLTPVLYNFAPAGGGTPSPAGLTSGTAIVSGGLGGSETRPASVVLTQCVNSGSGTGISITPFSPPPQTLSNLIAPDANIMMADYNQIIADGNAMFTTIQTAITAANSVTPMPAGAVVPFNLAVCPTGWVASDGTGGTVDMRGRFARVTTGTPAVGTVQTDQFLNHTHLFISAGAFVVGNFGPQLLLPTVGGNFSGITSLIALSVIDAVGANVGTETRPKNVSLLFCQKS